MRERGSRLSAGERQLVSLARAALVDPAVLVLDEATSNLDPGTEAVVEGALERLMRGRTVIVVAHRLSTVRRADRIAVVDHARIAELGTHDELMRNRRPLRAAGGGMGAHAGGARLTTGGARRESPAQPEARHHGRMIRHCVLFHFLPETTHDQIDGAAKLLLEYVATLDGVVSYRLGHDVGATDGNYDFGIVGDFETLDAYITYRDSPRHVEIAKGIVAPLLIERATVQFEIPDD